MYVCGYMIFLSAITGMKSLRRIASDIQAVSDIHSKSWKNCTKHLHTVGKYDGKKGQGKLVMIV